MAENKRATFAQRAIMKLRGKKEFEVKGALPMKPKSKKLPRTGKCSPGKKVVGGKCIPDPNYKKPAKKGFGEGVLYKSMEPGDKASALAMRASKILKKK